MNDLVLVDTNLLLLYIVGRANRNYIRGHKRLSGYNEADFDLPVQTISAFSDIVLLPHVLAEVSKSGTPDTQFIGEIAHSGEAQGTCRSNRGNPNSQPRWC